MGRGLFASAHTPQPAWNTRGGPSRARSTMRHERMEAWSALDDRAILEAYNRLGPKWQQIAREVPGRSVASVRNRFLRIQKGERQRSAGIAKNRCHACGELKLGHICKVEKPMVLVQPVFNPESRCAMNGLPTFGANAAPAVILSGGPSTAPLVAAPSTVSWLGAAVQQQQQQMAMTTQPPIAHAVLADGDTQSLPQAPALLRELSAAAVAVAAAASPRIDTDELLHGLSSTEAEPTCLMRQHSAEILASLSVSALGA